MEFNENMLKSIIANTLKIISLAEIEFTNNLSFQNDLGMGSIELVEIMVEVETQFGIEFDFDEIGEILADYGKLKEYVVKKVGLMSIDSTN